MAKVTQKAKGNKNIKKNTDSENTSDKVKSKGHKQI